MRYQIRSILLEDEPQSMRKLEEQLSTFSDIDIIGKAEDLDSAFEIIREERPQAAFMDIKLTGGNALQLIDRLERHHIPVPWIVMITGYPEYAVQVLNEYRKHVVKFLTKPVMENWQSKFRDAIDTLHLAIRADMDKGYYFIRTDTAIEKISYEDLVWVEVMDKGKGKIYLVTDQATGHAVNLTLHQFLSQYAFSPIRRISREEAINKDRILRILPATREVVVRYRDGEKTFGIGDAYYNILISELQKF